MADRRRRLARRPPGPRHDLDLGRDLPLVVGELVGVDLAVVAAVQRGEEAAASACISPAVEEAVAVAVRLVEPVGERVFGPLCARNASPIGLMKGAHG